MKSEDNKKKDTVKEKLIIFTIGVLIGAIISTGAFFAYIKLAGNNNSGQSMQMPSGAPPEIPGGAQGGTPPDKPSDEDSQSKTPSEKSNSEQDNSL